MMAFQHDDAPAGVRSAAPRLAALRRPHADPAPRALAGRLLRASELLAADRDEAAFVLDGLLRDIAAAWFNRRDMAPGDAGAALDGIEREQPLFAWRLRLALRAPDVEARLAHCAALIALLLDAEAAPGPASDPR